MTAELTTASDIAVSGKKAASSASSASFAASSKMKKALGLHSSASSKGDGNPVITSLIQVPCSAALSGSFW
ncbi:unnamed protein product [Urochloa humidicola]